jgi:hypothetical protein
MRPKRSLPMKSGVSYLLFSEQSKVNISKMEQRALHTLAQGGAILIERDKKRKITKARCVNRDGWHLSGFSVDLFKN